VKGLIFVIDDDSSVRSLVVAMLKQHGFQTMTAVNADSAMAILQSAQRPDMILVDLIMPRIDGVQFIQWLRSQELFKDLPVILMTANHHPDFLQDVETLNLKGLLLKPVDEKKLVQKVESIFLQLHQGS